MNSALFADEPADLIPAVKPASLRRKVASRPSAPGQAVAAKMSTRGPDMMMRDMAARYLRQYVEKSATWYSKSAAVEDFVGFLESQGVNFVSGITQAVTTGYKHHLAVDPTSKTGKPRTKCGQRSVTVIARHFMRFLVDTPCAFEPAVFYAFKLAKYVRPSVYMPGVAVLARMLAVCDDYWDEAKHPDIKYIRATLRRFFRARLRVILAIQMSTGNRIGETLALRLTDYDTDRKVLWVRETKTGVPRDVPVTPDLACELAAWLRVRPKKSPSDFLIVTENGTRLDRGACTRQCQRYLAWAREQGVDLPPRITMHSLRHVAGSAMATVNPNHARIVLGHSDIKTTITHYTHTTTDEVRATHQATDSLGKVLAEMSAHKPASRPRGRKLA